VRWFRRGDKRAMDWWGADAPPPGRRAVNQETATYLTPVFAAWRHIVDFVSTLPLDSYRMDDTTRTSITLPALFRSQNEPGRAGAGQWVGQAVFGLVSQGNAVGWVVETDGFGFPTVVRWLRREDWSYDEQESQWYVGGQPTPGSRLLHIPWIVPTGCTLGLSPIEHFAEIVRAGLSAQEYADVKRGGGLPPAVLKNNKVKLDQEQARAVRSRVVKSFASGEPFVTGMDWDLTLMTIPPNHAQFIETMKLSANQIAAIYGIAPEEVGGEPANSLTYANEEMRQTVRAHNVRPYISRLEQAFNRVLPERQFVKLNIDATVRADIKTRTDVIGAQIADGRLSVNEARALEDRPPVTGGDFHNVPAPKAEPTTRTGETP
jgi:HK97 family phage portal protein